MVEPTEAWSRAPRDRLWQRLLQVGPIRLLLGLVFLTPGAAVLQSPQWFRVPSELAAAASFIVFCAGLAGYAHVVERRPAVEIGRRGALLEWSSGLVIGFLLLAATVGVLVAMGSYRVSPGVGVAALRNGIVFSATHTLFEELLVRVLLFKITEESFGSWPALVIQAAIFGAMHLGNPHATLVAAIAIAVEAGVLLAGAYALTRRVWLAWGIHFGWNVAQSNFFGVVSSGHRAPSAWLRSAPVGAGAWTGGAFGVEASPIAVGLCLCAAVPLLVVASRTGRLVSRRTTSRSHTILSR
jgi:membrane protease YdiL (CAAX protease family)